MHDVKKGLGILVCTFILLIFPASAVQAQTGKITGTITDANTGEPLPGVNVVVDGTTLGAASDVDGYYVILNLPPGTYALRASLVGFTTQVIQSIRVNIDLTATVDMILGEETVGLEEMIVLAEKPVVQRDISASRIDVSASDIENLPVSDITAVVGLQAGVQGLSIRGSDANEMGFVIDGLGLNGARDNAPFTEVSYTAIQEVQLQSGGFTAEYGNIRSGLVNVVTKEGPRDRYTADILIKYSSASRKNFGIAPNDYNSYWMRPYTDDAVAWVGTQNGSWDEETRKQYPSFVGFNTISQQTLQDDNPNNDLTPEQAQQLFLWQHRRDLSVDRPDYTIDATFGGPVPLVSRKLGDLRFVGSFRQTEDQYIVPLTTDGYKSITGQLKVTSDLGAGKKLMIQGLTSTQTGTSGGDWSGGRDYISNVRQENRTNNTQYYSLDIADLLEAEDVMFSTAAISLAEVHRDLIGAKFTHSLSATTFYELTAQHYRITYDSNPPRARNTAIVQHFGNYGVDEAPFGYSNEPASTYTGLTMGPHLSVDRDSSQVTQWNLEGNLTSQLGKFHQLKVGGELNLEHQDINGGKVDYKTSILNQWDTHPVLAGAYVQDKIEFKGMIANVGLRLDYQDPRLEWYDLDDPFNAALLARNAGRIDSLLTKSAVKAKLTVSPRLGVSFPVTNSSKLYFNYGHFYQTLNSQDLFMEQRNQNGYLLNLSNPNAPQQKTIAYELGFEQSLFDRYLIRLAGYYKDVSNQSRWALYVSKNNALRYTINQPSNYEDVRGFEITLFKNQGRWLRGFLNYTYMVHTEGNFGFGGFHEDRLQQQDYEDLIKEYYQSKPIPQPYARANVEFTVPPEVGPKLGGVPLLGDWRISVLANWVAGNHFTWTAGQVLGGVRNNVQWMDFKMVDLRVAKNIRVAGNDVQFYVDIDNVFNLKYLNQFSFYGPDDFDNYMQSLHLPQKVADELPGYNNTPGKDRPGDLPDYADPPNGNAFRYLYPRDVFFGVRVSF